MKYTIVILALLPICVAAQDMPKISFEFGVQKHQFAMGDFNEYALDSNYYEPILYNNGEPPTQTIKYGYSFSENVNYRILRFLDVGIYGMYQYGKMVRRINYAFQIPPDDPYFYYGKYTMTTSCWTVGLSSTFYLNQILRWSEKQSLLKNTVVGLEFAGGIAFSKLKDKQYFVGSIYTGSRINIHATDVTGHIALKLGYRYLKNSFFSEIGIKGGYQLLKTGTLKNDKGYVANSYPEPRSIRLDFSGFFAGIYLNFGK